MKDLNKEVKNNKNFLNNSQLKEKINGLNCVQDNEIYIFIFIYIFYIYLYFNVTNINKQSQ